MFTPFCNHTGRKKCIVHFHQTDIVRRNINRQHKTCLFLSVGLAVSECFCLLYSETKFLFQKSSFFALIVKKGLF